MATSGLRRKVLPRGFHDVADDARPDEPFCHRRENIKPSVNARVVRLGFLDRIRQKYFLNFFFKTFHDCESRRRPLPANSRRRRRGESRKESSRLRRVRRVSQAWIFRPDLSVTPSKNVSTGVSTRLGITWGFSVVEKRVSARLLDEENTSGRCDRRSTSVRYEPWQRLLASGGFNPDAVDGRIPR